MKIIDIRLIRTKTDYETALAEIERLFDAAPNTPDGDRLLVLDLTKGVGYVTVLH